MKNVIGRLGKPRLSLIKALCGRKYGERHHTASEMNTVIAENELHLYRANGSIRTEKQIQDAMSEAHKKLKQPKEREKIDHHPSCRCAMCESSGGHIVVNPYS